MTKLEKRFFSRFAPMMDDRGCWEWFASIGSHGYGDIRYGPKNNNKHHTAHRLSWIIHNGPIPKGFFVCHKCDNRTCVNPQHLFIGTAKENSDDMQRKGRKRSNPPRGTLNKKAKLTEDAVLHIMKKEMSLADYARLYGVSYQSIGYVQSGKNWSHVTS